MFGHPAFRRLIALKLRGVARSQVRKLRRPLGWIFMLIGVGLVLAWYVSFFVMGAISRQQIEHDPATLVLGAQLMMLFLVLLTIVSAFSHRGLLLPKEEIELAFSAPVPRSDLVRYRLLVNLLRSLVTAIVFGMVSALRMPAPALAFVGTLLSVATIPILGQAVAILLGGTENRIARAAQKLPLRRMGGLLAILVIGALALAAFADEDALSEIFGEFPAGPTPLQRFGGHPIVHALLLPFTPWARMITATDLTSFLPWLGFCLVFWLASFELTARIPVDFRELSLATSADVARRINRARRGWVGASSIEVNRQALGWRVPWLFGRGSFGAVAWLKLGQIVRKARGTLVISAVIVFAVAALFTRLLSEPSYENALLGSGILAGVGTLYLCMGLRFDFRADLELLPLIKTWPLAPWRIFLATILPEVALVSLLLWTAVLVRGALTDNLIPDVALVLVLQPLVTFTWVAVDNTVFLFSPLRYNPGQDGTLQHMGRSVVLLFARGLVFGGIGLIAAVPVGLWIWVAQTELELSLRGTLLGAAGLLGATLLVADALLVAAGGWMLRRFDVARDRG